MFGVKLNFISNMKLLLFLSISCTFGITSLTSSPCTTHESLPHMDKRDITVGNHGICDNSYIPINGKWYKVEGQQVLTNESLVSFFTCGTEVPIWVKLQDGQNFPENFGDTQWYNACIPSIVNKCSSILPIAIRNCGNYSEYFLNQPHSCDIAYCFKKPPSHKVDKPTIVPDFDEKGPHEAKYQILIFKCSLNTTTFDLRDYLYHVLWTADGEIIFSSQVVEYSKRNLTYLRTANFNEEGLDKLGILLKCVVRMKNLNSENGPFGPSSESDSKFIGIKLLNPVIQLIEGEKMSDRVLLQPTIPIPCFGKGSQFNCSIQLDIATQESECNPLREKHRKSDTTVKKCKLHIPNINWNITSAFEISWGISNKYAPPAPDRPNGYFVVQLKTVSLFHTKIWDNYILPPIYVQYTETQDTAVWEGKQCYAVNDPHMKTFNGRTFENQNPGIFLLYSQEKNPLFPVQVDIETTKCNDNPYSQPYCVCGMAARVGQDLFVINRCTDIDIGFRFCNDGLIDVRKLGEYSYKIYLPSGTSIDVSLIDYTGVRTMNVLVSPTAVDVDKTGGLCDKLNSDGSVSFTLRSGRQTENPTAFVNDWRISKENSVLYEKNVSNLSAWKKDELFCLCINGDIGNCSHENIMTCDRNEKDALSPNRCKIITRQHQYLRHTQKIQPKMKKKFRVFQHTDTEASLLSKYSLQWTEETAESYCLEFMNTSKVAMLCSEIPSVDFYGTISNCVADIMLTNETIWAIDSRENLRLSCMKEIKQNTTLTENTTSEYSTIVEAIQQISCPNECSGNGNCSEGVCICRNGYGASDCSYDLSVPPDVFSIDIGSGDICDLNNCKEVFVDGDGFLNTETLTCRLQQFYITSNMTFQNKGIKSVKGIHNTIAEIQCSVPQPYIDETDPDLKDIFVHGYRISVSNTGEEFSISRPLFILDSTCQFASNSSGNIVFVLKENFCFINGNCIRNGTIDGSNKCRKCQPDLQKFSWSWIEGCEKSEGSHLWIIGAVLGGLALLVSIIGLILFVLKHKRPRIDVFVEEMSRVPPSLKK